MIPPFRTKDEISGLWGRLSNNEISIIGSDHCVYSDEQKKRHSDKTPPFNEVPNGTPGTETILPLLFTKGVMSGKITMEQMVSITSKNTAELFGLKSKGNLLPGYDADIAIVDPKKEFKVSYEMLHSNINYSVFDGMILKGFPESTILRGKKVFENGNILSEAGTGKYIGGKIEK